MLWLMGRVFERPIVTAAGGLQRAQSDAIRFGIVSRNLELEDDNETAVNRSQMR